MRCSKNSAAQGVIRYEPPDPVNLTLSKATQWRNHLKMSHSNDAAQKPITGQEDVGRFEDAD